MDLSQLPNESPTIKLRDKRKPGHCWQDNELYDCFQPVIGALAVSVYVRITRECYGTAVRLSVRELAALTGISKSAVARAMAVLLRVGLIAAKREAVKRAAEFDLADLKELAIGYGAVYDGKRCSYILPPEKCRALRLEVKQLGKRMHGSGVPHGDSYAADVENTGVPQETFGVPREGQWCPPNAENATAQQNSKKARIRNKSNTPLPPSPGGETENGLQAEKREDAAWLAGWNGVMQDLHGAMMQQRPLGVEQRMRGMEEWELYFAEMACEGVDRRGGCVGRLVLRVPNANTAQQGLAKYHKRIHAGMEKYFGRAVPVMLVDSS